MASPRPRPWTPNWGLAMAYWAIHAKDLSVLAYALRKLGCQPCRGRVRGYWHDRRCNGCAFVCTIQAFRSALKSSNSWVTAMIGTNIVRTLLFSIGMRQRPRQAETRPRTKHTSKRIRQVTARLRVHWIVRTYGNAVILALVSGVLITLRWKKMGSLLWLDPAHWLNEISRLARGELPYRDFSFQYPPFVVFLYGGILRVFGISFSVVQVITDIIDVSVVIAFYCLIRKLFPLALRGAVGCCLVCVCATSLMNFNIFSYVTYSPSLQTGALGLLLLLLSFIPQIAKERIGYGVWLLAACGGFMAMLSKPESILGSVVSLVIFALIVREPRRIWMIVLIVLVPALVAYTALARNVGFSNLLGGLTGYGLGTAFCPWWPTGIGVFGTLAALGQASMLMTFTTLPKWRKFAVTYGARYRALLWATPLAAAVYISYVTYQSRHALTAPGLSWQERARRTLPYVIYTTPVLEPVLWVCIVAFFVLAWRVLLAGDTRRGDAVLLLVLSAPVVMCIRSLFSSTQGIYPEVAGICYPFLLVLGPYLLWRFLDSAAGRSYAVAVVAAITVGYAVVRIVGGWPEMLSGAHYGTLYTRAGSVKLLNYDNDAKVYSYVMSHTSPDDYVLDLPYGGGVNFASGRRYPIFNVQLSGLGVSSYYEQLDLDLIRHRRPPIVIGEDEPNLGTYWGFGQKGNRACPCPRLVWAPDRPSWDPNHVFPVVKYIEENYRVADRIGNKVIWVPR